MRIAPLVDEEEEQKRVAAWLDKLITALATRKIRYYAVPNGGLRNKITGKRLKEMGVKSGVPDIAVCVPNQRYAGLYVEMKRESGGRLSESQKEWLRDLADLGYKAISCAVADAAKKAIVEYLGIDPAFAQAFPFAGVSAKWLGVKSRPRQWGK